MALTLKELDQDGRVIVKVQGEIDLYSSPQLREALLNAIPNAGELLAVDLCEVAYMDSSGVATLVEGLQAMGKAKKPFVLLAPSQAVLKVLQLSRLDSVFDIREVL